MPRARRRRLARQRRAYRRKLMDVFAHVRKVRVETEKFLNLVRRTTLRL